MEKAESIILLIDPDLEEIIPGYLERRNEDVEELKRLHQRADFAALKIQGHRLKGSGAAYGFEAITKIGREIEMAAGSCELEVIETAIAALASYLERVTVIYE